MRGFSHTCDSGGHIASFANPRWQLSECCQELSSCVRLGQKLGGRFGYCLLVLLGGGEGGVRGGGGEGGGRFLFEIPGRGGAPRRVGAGGGVCGEWRGAGG